MEQSPSYPMVDKYFVNTFMKSTEEIAGYKRSCYIGKIIAFRNVNTDAKKSTVIHSFSGVVEFILACRTGVIFLRISGEQRRKQGERAAGAKHELRVMRGSLKNFSDPPLTRNSRPPHFSLCLPEIRKKSCLFCRLNSSSIIVIN